MNINFGPRIGMDISHYKWEREGPNVASVQEPSYSSGNVNWGVGWGKGIIFGIPVGARVIEV
ncbi:unnamed protein product [Soboliphyme baturini]|uniref:Pept_C1 domain-containing protein n=1 Tax=Soboliphyme baturini TaxID=241478 RepID=A0A183J3R1_9BILA|nr:unnamed protein product [Soboliphyme baturini]